ncbi:MAG: HypC/HybG/HupF family hydrogenase formation chaperone [Pseudomonadota bacterium]|jgi:hydrogenase expression/formation protein HypC
MCLAIPARIIELLADNMAVVELEGVRKIVSVSLIEAAAVDDFVIVHVGYALQKLDREEAACTLAMFDELRSENAP